VDLDLSNDSFCCVSCKIKVNYVGKVYWYSWWSLTKWMSIHWIFSCIRRTCFMWEKKTNRIDEESKCSTICNVYQWKAYEKSSLMFEKIHLSCLNQNESHLRCYFSLKIIYRIYSRNTIINSVLNVHIFVQIRLIHSIKFDSFTLYRRLVYQWMKHWDSIDPNDS
jgi:hypothetical protein